MRRIIVLCAVLALISIVSVSQASAFGWRHRGCHGRTTVVVAPQVEVAVASSELTVQVDESAALSEVIKTMQGMLRRENERLQWGLQYYEECDDSSTYGSD